MQKPFAICRASERSLDVYVCVERIVPDLDFTTILPLLCIAQCTALQLVPDLGFTRYAWLGKKSRVRYYSLRFSLTGVHVLWIWSTTYELYVIKIISLVNFKFSVRARLWKYVTPHIQYKLLKFLPRRNFKRLFWDGLIIILYHKWTNKVSL
jgi:hypothetical protein